MIFIAHGYNDNPGTWPNKVLSTIRSSRYYTDEWDLLAYDWQIESDRFLTATQNGYLIGQAIARSIVEGGDQYEILHLVGQSLGAHLIQGIADEYHRLGGRARVQLTFLDPYQIRGIFRWGFGAANFGRNADFAESYIDIEDGLPGTNSYLPLVQNFDMSAVVPPDFQDKLGYGHWWLVRFYQYSVDSTQPGFYLSPMAREYRVRQLFRAASDSAKLTPEMQAVVDAVFNYMPEAYPPGEVTVMHTQ